MDDFRFHVNLPGCNSFCFWWFSLQKKNRFSLFRNCVKLGELQGDGNFNKQPGFIRRNRSPGNDPTVAVHTTVEGKNPANQLRLVVEIPLFTRF